MQTAHEKKLREVAALAAEVADLIHENGDSPNPRSGMQQRMLRELRAPGSVDEGLLAIEGVLRGLAKMIGAHLASQTG